MIKAKNTHRNLVGRPKEKISVGRPNRRWKKNFEVDLREIGWSDVYWIYLAHDMGRLRAVMGSVRSLRVA